jgi:PPM family protein phosphatase
VVVADVVDLRDSEAPSTSPQIVGAASLRDREGKRTRGLPISPAEKAASLARSVRAPSPDDDDDGPVLAEEPRSRRVIWVRRVVLAFAVALILAGGGYAAYAWTQNQYYVKATDGYVAIWQGVGQNIGPLTLSRVYQVTDIPVTELPIYVQNVVANGTPLGSLADAFTRVSTLRTSATDCRGQAASGVPCGQNPVTTPSPSTTPVTPTDTATTSVPGLTAGPTTGSTP